MTDTAKVPVVAIRLANPDNPKPHKSMFGYALDVVYVLADGRSYLTEASYRLARDAKAAVASYPLTPKCPTWVSFGDLFIAVESHPFASVRPSGVDDDELAWAKAVADFKAAAETPRERAGYDFAHSHPRYHPRSRLAQAASQGDLTT